MAYTKDDIIAYQDETLDNIEALLNLKVGSKVKSDEGDIYMIGTSIAFDIEVDYYLIIVWLLNQPYLIMCCILFSFLFQSLNIFITNRCFSCSITIPSKLHYISRL